jgi:uncharacterized membrane protein
MFPPIPSWDGLHPLVVHFPIALLIVAPSLVVAGLILHRQYLWFSVSALLLMVLGTISAFVAVSTGKAAGELVLRDPQINEVIMRHLDLAQTTAWVFLGLTLLFAALTFVPPAVKRPFRRLTGTIVALIFLLIYGAGTLLLANAAHQGGRLVHELGVRGLG